MNSQHLQTQAFPSRLQGTSPCLASPAVRKPRTTAAGVPGCGRTLHRVGFAIAFPVASEQRSVRTGLASVFSCTAVSSATQVKRHSCLQHSMETQSVRKSFLTRTPRRRDLANCRVTAHGFFAFSPRLASSRMHRKAMAGHCG